MTVYKRKWKTTNGETRTAWRVHYYKTNGKRSARQFRTKEKALEFNKACGVMPRPHRPNRAVQYFKNVFLALAGK